MSDRSNRAIEAAAGKKFNQTKDFILSVWDLLLNKLNKLVAVFKKNSWTPVHSGASPPTLGKTYSNSTLIAKPFRSLLPIRSFERRCERSVTLAEVIIFSPLSQITKPIIGLLSPFPKDDRYLR